MKKLKFNGMEIEFEDDIELSFEGNKVTVKSRTPYVVYQQPYQYWYPTPYTYPIYTIPNTGTITITGGTTGIAAN